MDFISSCFLIPSDEIFLYCKTLKQKRFVYETKLAELHEMTAIIEEKIEFEHTSSKKTPINSHDKLMYKLYHCKSLNKSQKLLYKVAGTYQQTRENHANDENFLRRKKSKSQIIGNISNENSRGKENFTCFVENAGNFNQNEQRVSFSTADNSNINRKNEISSMNDQFWSKILTADLRDNSQLSDALFERKNMVSLKNFMEISKKNQPKNPKIYFNHKIYREMSEDYKPKVLTSRECTEFF